MHFSSKWWTWTEQHICARSPKTNSMRATFMHLRILWSNVHRSSDKEGGVAAGNSFVKAASSSRSARRISRGPTACNSLRCEFLALSSAMGEITSYSVQILGTSVKRSNRQPGWKGIVEWSNRGSWPSSSRRSPSPAASWSAPSRCTRSLPSRTPSSSCPTTPTSPEIWCQLAVCAYKEKGARSLAHRNSSLSDCRSGGLVYTHYTQRSTAGLPLAFDGFVGAPTAHELNRGQPAGCVLLVLRIKIPQVLVLLEFHRYALRETDSLPCA